MSNKGKTFACYLIDVRNDGAKDRSQKDLTFHRVVVKEDQPLPHLQHLGEELLQQHPDCDRVTIIGSGKRRHTQWLYDSANKMHTMSLLTF